MLVISIIGLFFNGLAFYIAHYKLKQRTASIWIMAVIGIVDILVCLVIIVTEITKYATHFEIVTNNYFCQYSGMCIMFFTMTTIDGVGILSLIRMLSIVKNIDVESIYAYTILGGFICFNLLINILGVHYDIMHIVPSQIYCMATMKGSFGEIFSYMLLAKFILMVIILLISYFYITIFYCRIIKPLNNKSYSSECFIGDTSSLSYQRGIIAKLVGLMLMYMICFLPMLVVISYNVVSGPLLKPIPYAISGATMNFTVIVNAAFVLLYQKEARNVLVNMLPNWIRDSNTCKKAIGLESFQY
jgi:hypothetical protein